MPEIEVSRTPYCDPIDGPDPDFAALAAAASRDAIARSFAAGIPITYMNAGKLFEKFPDGRIREISEKEMQAMLEGHPWP
jgi:hypothetical protein